ncbi:MAG TPA: hypothetical protein VG938_05395 [Verrucomicrobiae bacterium]|nr:hypothetical protein [Verrucomicrobiae bacterium]
MSFPSPIDLKQLRVYPLETRRSLTRIDDVLLSPEAERPAVPEAVAQQIAKCADSIREAKAKGAAILLIYGAHLLRNGAGRILDRMMERGWITHLATNGAGSIHDWEYSFLGRSTEKVEENVAAGTFGTWDETGRYIHLALLAGSLDNLGYGGSLGRFISREELTLPSREELEQWLRQMPAHPLAPAWADLLGAEIQFDLPVGKIHLAHRWKHASILGQAFRRRVPLTVHPGIGYDIISNHPMFNGAVIGRAAGFDFRQFGAAVDRLDNGVVLSIGSAIMGPQVFEKSLSCVHNLRFQQKRPPVQNYSIYVVDLQEGDWDWSAGEPPKSHPAYYLRFCKSFSRMGGMMRYLCCDNTAFMLHLCHHLEHT